MEELEQLILLIGKLPTLAIWVLVGFFAYKTIVIGSTYGIIRLAIVKIHDWLTYKKGTHSITLKDLADCNIITESDRVYVSQIINLLKDGAAFSTLSDKRMIAVIEFLKNEYPRRENK